MKKETPFFFPLLKLWLIIFTLIGTNSFANQSEKVQLSLISESKTVGRNSTLLLGLQAKIAPGWKTYWRSPGVAGYGVNLNWEGSHNVKSVQLLWPLPHRAHTQMGQVNAYDGEVVFPLRVELINPTQKAHIVIDVDMLVCDEGNCLPVMKTLTLDLPSGSAVESPQAPQLQQAMNKIPKRVDTQSELGTLQIQSAEIVNTDDVPPILQIVLSKKRGVFTVSDLPELFLEIKDMFVDTPLISLSKDQKFIQYTSAIYPDANRTATYLPNIIGKPVTLTIDYNDERFEIDQEIKKQPLGFGFLAIMLLIAFVGGLILNIMPCVLPVLSIKVLSIIRHGGGHKKAVRQEFLATVLGILFSFFILGSVAILLKISGHAVGWGVQFQEPFFLIGLIGILTLFACNLFGYFEFRLPYFLSSLGGISPHRESLVGSFLEGSLVTALATPCTAPFLGTALAFALSRGIPEILSIFLAMGLGLAFPFLLIALFPKFATKLPKPGAWMITVRYLLGTLITLTAVWLIYVLVAEIGSTGAMIVAVLMLIISLFLKSSRKRSDSRKKMAWAAASFLIAASFSLPLFTHHHDHQAAIRKGSIWHPFEPSRIPGYVKAGKTVIVSVTADWCLTCQANKYFVLRKRDVLEALQDKNVVAMEADWTNHDPKITSYLKSFNQYGIPFYAVYGCKTPVGRFLGQILTPQKVLDALESEKCPVPVK